MFAIGRDHMQLSDRRKTLHKNHIKSYQIVQSMFAGPS